MQGNRGVVLATSPQDQEVAIICHGMIAIGYNTKQTREEVVVIIITFAFVHQNTAVPAPMGTIPRVEPIQIAQNGFI